MPASATAPIFPGGLTAQFESSDFEEMAALPAKWNMLCRQVEPSAFEGWMHIVQTERVQFGKVYWGRGVAIDGLPPPGSCTLMLIMDDYPASRLRGRPVRSSELVALMPSDEIEAVMPDSFHLFSIPVEEKRLLEYVDAVHGKPLGEFVRASRCALNKEKTVLSSQLLQLHKMAQSRPEILSDPVQARFFEESLLAAYARSLAPPAGRVPGHKRLELVRSLFLAFQEAFGMPPWPISRLCA